MNNILQYKEEYRAAYRKAAAATAPQPGESTESFLAVQEARALLDKHHGLSVEQVNR
ncbi:MAG: hypothetical protein NVS1B5_14530 [Gemmatimonadaceae bacterium]